MDIKNLIWEEESLYLEFKSEWYWANNEKATEAQWGEFLKDLVALVNCNVSYVEENKYLIIGINEDEDKFDKRVIETNISSKKYVELDDLKKEIIVKINNFFRIDNHVENDVYNNFSLSYEKAKNQATKESRNIIVFTIRPARGVLILNKNLKVKDRTETQNHVFIRDEKSNKEPEVIHASPKILEELKIKLRNYNIQKRRDENKEKSIEKTISLFMQKNQSFKLKNVKSEKIKSENIYFELYRIDSEFTNITYIYLYNNVNVKRTIDYLTKEKLITNQAQNWILLDTELENRKDEIAKKFNTDKVFLLDVFALEHLYKDYFNEPIYHDGDFKKQRQIKNFIEPFTKMSTKKNAFMILSEWYKKESKPLMVIKGFGGVGKTTLVKYFLDEQYEENETKKIKSKILFIDSREIIDVISRQGEIDNLYDFYNALAKSRDLEKVFTKELLELSIDNGSLLIVVDGIDEVITKLGIKFNIKRFIETIYENYSIGYEKTKIILTCRDYFWDNSISNKYKIDTLELKAFNLDLTEQFFEKQFEKKSKNFKRCISYSTGLAILNKEINKDEEDIYIPYILDIILDLVKQNEEFDDVNKNDIESKLLNTKLHNDYFIGKVCNREIEKLENINVDNQLKVFMNMAVQYQGCVVKASEREIFRDLSVEVTDELLTKFRGHPLIIYERDTYYFRYDFFKEYFINLYISEFFLDKKNTILNKEMKQIIIDHISYDNSFTKTICNRIEFNDDFKLFVMDISGELLEELKENENIDLRKLISAMLILLLVGLEESTYKNDIIARTEILTDIFGSDKELDYLSLVNIYRLSSLDDHTIKKDETYPIFDFTNKTISNSWFENYAYFWECKIDESTKFYKSYFNHLEPIEGGKKPKIKSDKIFFDCDTSGIKEILEEENIKKANKEAKNRDKIIKIFRYFLQGGTFKEQKIDYINNKCKDDEDILEKLKNHKIIHPYINSKKPTMKQYKVSDEYYDLIKVITQGGTNVELEKILKILF